jgi:hypothetical protein
MGAGNTTMKEPPTGDFGNMTRTGGPGSGMGGGNMTSMDFGNTTRPEFDDQAFGNMTHPEFGNQTFGNMTAPEFGNQTFGNMTAPDMHDNSTQMHHRSDNQTATNATPPSDGQGNAQGGQNQPASSSGQSTTQAQQQSKDDVITSLISQLQALLSGKT